MADKQISVSCPKCGLGVTLEKGFFGWKKEECPKCRTKISFDEARTQIMTCTGCGRDVAYDLERKNNCPICNRALVDNDENHVSVQCPECHLVVELVRGMFGWKKQECPKCGKKIRMKDSVTQIVTCPGCQREVVYDLKRGNNCPSCNHALTDLASQALRTSVPCPKCQVPVVWSPGDTSAVCVSCGYAFNPAGEAGKQDGILSNDAPDIRMTEELAADELVWQHPLNCFPLNARIIARPGYTAVCVQGDQQAFAVNGQSVVLSETNLTADAYQYGEYKNKFVYVNIYYVRNAVSGSFPWGGAATLVNEHNQMHKFSMFGRGELAPIADHAAFLRWIRFDTSVKAADFASAMDSRGGETVGEYAKQIRSAMLGCYDIALRSVRDRLGLPAEMIPAHRAEVQEEILACANEKLAEWGVQLRSVAAEKIELTATEGYVDVLRARIEGSAVNWQTDLMHVHVKDEPGKYAQIRMNGSFYVRIADEAKLNQSVSAALWRKPEMAEDCARREIAEHAGNMLGSMFTALFQQLIDDMNPPLETLQTFAGYLKAKAEQLLNAQGDYLADRGLNASQLVVKVGIVAKSEAYARHEQLVNAEDKATVEAKLYEYQKKLDVANARTDSAAKREIEELKTEDELAGLKNEGRLDDARTEAIIRKAENEAKLAGARAELEHKKVLEDIARQTAQVRAKGELSFQAWQEQSRLETEKEKQAYQQARYRQGQEQAMQIDKAMHDKAMHDIVRAVEESDMSWREKLDAYERLCRSNAFQDALEQDTARSRAETDSKTYAGQQELKLNAETSRLMAELEAAAKQREEEQEQARFVRDLELRRQRLAEDMERLNAQFAQERALAAEESRRLELQQENTAMRQVLEYLVKVGDQQVTQATLQTRLAEAKAAAERDYQEKREAEEKQQAEKRRQEQLRREDVMSERAYNLTQDMMQIQGKLEEMKLENVRAYESGRAMVDAKGREYQEDQLRELTRRMETLRDTVTEMKNVLPAQNQDNSGILDKVLATLLNGMGGLSNVFSSAVQGAVKTAATTVAQTPTAAVQTPAAPAEPAANLRACLYCGYLFNANEIKCPKCGKI